MNVEQEDEDFNLPEVREFIGPSLQRDTIYLVISECTVQFQIFWLPLCLASQIS